MQQPGKGDRDGRDVVSCTPALTPGGRPCPLQGSSTPVSEESSSSRVSGIMEGLEAGAPESHSWKPSTGGQASQLTNNRRLLVGTVEASPEVSQQAGHPAGMEEQLLPTHMC